MPITSTGGARGRASRSYRGGSGGSGVGSSNTGRGSSGGGGSSSSSKKTTTSTSQLYYYNPQTKSYSTAKVSGQTGVSRAQALSKASSAPSAIPGAAGGLSSTQLSRARALTESAQKAEFGRVVYKQAGGDAASKTTAPTTQQPKSITLTPTGSKTQFITRGEERTSNLFGSPTFIAKKDTRQSISTPEDKTLAGTFKSLSSSISRISKSKSRIEQAGGDTGVSGKIFSILAKGTQGASKQVEKASYSKVPFVSELTKLTPKSVGGAFIAVGAVANPALTLNVAKGTVSFIAASEGTKVVGSQTALSKSERKFVSKPIFKESIREARAAEVAALGGGFVGTIKKTGYELSPAIPSLVAKAASKITGKDIKSKSFTIFERTLAKSLSEKGLKGQELETAYSAGIKFRKVSTVGEATGLLAVSTYSEKLGKRLVTKEFAKTGSSFTKKKAFGTVAKKVFTPIAKAGLVEGIGTEVGQRIARTEKIDTTSAIRSGAIGAATAGALGSTIVGTSVAGKGKLSKSLLRGAYIADPFELPGDLTEGAISRIGKDIGIKVVTPSISVAPSKTLSFATSTSNVPTKGSTTVTLGSTPTSSPTYTSTISPTYTPTTSPTGTPSPTTTSTSTFTPTPTSTPVPIPTETTTPVPITTPVSIPTEIPTSITLPIPVTVPNFKLPPIVIPPSLPGGGGGGGFKGFRFKKSRASKYQASLTGVVYKKKRSKKDILTGLEIRGI